MEINLLCDNPGIMCPSRAATGGCVNASLYAEYYFMRTLLYSTTVMGGPISDVFSWGPSGLIYLLLSPVSFIPVLVLSTIFFGVGPK